MSKPLKEIVETRLAELGRNPFEAARKGGLERSYVNDILNEKKKSIRADKIGQLAAALDMRVADLGAAGITPQQMSAPITGGSQNMTSSKAGAAADPKAPWGLKKILQVTYAAVDEAFLQAGFPSEVSEQFAEAIRRVVAAQSPAQDGLTEEGIARLAVRLRIADFRDEFEQALPLESQEQPDPH